MSAQLALEFRTNRDLISNHYLDENLPATEAWTEVSAEELEDAFELIQSLWDDERDTVPLRNEPRLEQTFIRPVFEELGIPFEVEGASMGEGGRLDSPASRSSRGDCLHTSQDFAGRHHG